MSPGISTSRVGEEGVNRFVFSTCWFVPSKAGWKVLAKNLIWRKTLLPSRLSTDYNQAKFDQRQHQYAVVPPSVIYRVTAGEE